MILQKLKIADDNGYVPNVAVRRVVQHIQHPKHWFDYYVGRNPLGPPYYGWWCIRNFLWNTGITPWFKFVRERRAKEREGFSYG